MGSLIASTHFSTADLPAIDQFDAWRDKISAIFDVTRIGGTQCNSFDARVTAYQLGNLLISDSAQGEQAYQITPKRIRRSGIDLFQVGFYRRGGYNGDANGSQIEGRTGDVQLLELGQPMQSVEPASDMICVFMPREMLQDRIGDLDGLHGAGLGAGLSRLLVDYLALLAERLPFLPKHDGEAVANATLDMISACLRPTAKRVHGAQSPIGQVLIRRAKQLIEANLRSPQLTPDFLCRSMCVSRRSLYRLFEPLDGVHHYILRRRLDHVMRALNNPSDHQRIADLAASYGFNCQETFWRAFKRRYRVTPGDVRSLRSTGEDAESRGNAGEFDEWLKQLHA